MILDSNAYFGSWPFWEIPAWNWSDFQHAMQRCEIDAVCLSSLRAVFIDPPGGNEEICRLAEENPQQIIPALSFNPYSQSLASFLSQVGNGPAIVKLFPLQHSYVPAEEPAIRALFEECSSRNIPILIPYRLLMSWRVPVLPLAQIQPLLESFPDTSVIIGSINYLFELQTVLDLMRRYPQLWLDTSAMMAYREIETVVESVGAHRLIHGSGMPLQQPAIGPAKLRRADIPQAAKEQILGTNLQQLIGFPLSSAQS